MGYRGPQDSGGADLREHLSAAAALAAALRRFGQGHRGDRGGRPERVAIVASGGMSHYPGTWKYPQPAYDFDYWAIAQMERGNLEPLLKLSSEQLDEVGNTEMLPWYFLFGAFEAMGETILAN